MACPDVMELERYVLRELDESESSSIASHLSTCGDCEQAAADLRENLELAPSLRRAAEASAPRAMPESIGPYRIIRKLGQGGMGSVFEAQQENPRRVVALKMIRPGVVSAPLLARLFLSGSMPAPWPPPTSTATT